MIKSFLIAAAFVATATNAAPAERTFSDDGQTYSYSTASDAQGRIVLTGRNLGNGVAFRYVIDGQRVSGFTGSERVNFRIARPIARAAGSTALASAR